MKHKTIRNHKDFLTGPQDIKVRSVCFYVKTKKSHIPDESRYGIVVTKRRFKKATERNRAKRVMRDWIAYSEDLFLPNIDYIFIPNDEILDYNREQGRKDTIKALKRIKKAYLEKE